MIPNSRSSCRPADAHQIPCLGALYVVGLVGPSNLRSIQKQTWTPKEGLWNFPLALS